MRILVAADSFKGTLTAPQACAAIAQGLRAVNAEWTVDEMPLADGGEGTLDVLLRGEAGRIHEAEVHGPLGEIITARFGMLDKEPVGIVEMAEASGYLRVARESRDVMRASTYGTGELIRAAIARGARRVLIGAGGSATCDGGAGCLQALGARMLDAGGLPLADGIGGGQLHRVARIERSGMLGAIRTAKLDLLCDVTNPLLGPAGAAPVFAPQKGATPAQVRDLEHNLTCFAGVLERDCGVPLAGVPHGGAAGGLAAGLHAAANAKLHAGADFVLEWLDFAHAAYGASAIITGEGRLDAQSLSGKLVSRVAHGARALCIPVYVLAGSVTLAPGDVAAHFADAGDVTALVKTPDAPPAEALREAARICAARWFAN